MSRRLAGLLAWALLLGGCAGVTPPPTADVTGHWTGTWSGHGAFDIPRDEDAVLDLVQRGQWGDGRLVMLGTLVAESVPESIRNAALAGTRILFEVSGDQIRLEHELGAALFEAEMVVRGDRMVGRVVGAVPEVRFDLTRRGVQTVEAELPSTPARAAPVPPPPPPPPPSAEPQAPPPVAEAPSHAPGPSDEPARRTAPSPVAFVAAPTPRTIHFAFDSAELRDVDRVILDTNAEWLRAHPDQLVLIEGHCDERGTAEYNLALGERRARSAMVYLLERGIAEARVTITSYGFERPVCAESTEACWARNRRAELLVTRR
jgi:peptidoglycan-associated lipoprotein